MRPPRAMSIVHEIYRVKKEPVINIQILRETSEMPLHMEITLPDKLSHTHNHLFLQEKSFLNEFQSCKSSKCYQMESKTADLVEDASQQIHHGYNFLAEF